ncbi:hypothetical protein J4N45_10855 [Vibrio sp. SCSIO 43140]|uniref:hypothetical protein n=1 Tax=Vibrio sp. SCSIO 43140 TaxID=2819100 RepID=UPI0020766763|nr:hypothetical protein [Vibrio sp. SCSIO 43140]USD59029.1 hypothetical protein J4N45_10855 [Vibrio sp. SCSIO 43140]
MLSKYPSAHGGVDSNGNELTEVIMPSLEGSGFTLIAHKDERTATLASKRHVLERTRMDLMSSLYVIDDAQCDLDDYRLQLKMDLDDKQWLEIKINNLKQTILDFKAKVKELRRLRKAKPTEFLESQLVAIAEKMTQ